jgi:hypothetical protein
MINYIQRHWKGENSLAWAFWINGIIVSAAASFVLSVFSGIFSAMLSGTTSLPIYIFLVVAGIWVIALWSVVGIWRSANLFAGNIAGDARRTSLFWAYAAKLTILIGVLNLVLISIQLIGPEIQLLVQTAL